MIQTFAALFGSRNKNRKIFFHALLSQKFTQKTGAQGFIPLILAFNLLWMYKTVVYLFFRHYKNL
jgi:hypothetical protein